MSSRASGGCGAQGRVGPGVLCSRYLVTGCWNCLGALACVWVPPSESWMMGLMAASGSHMATFPAPSPALTLHLLALRGLRPHLCSKHWLSLGLSRTDRARGGHAASASEVSQAQQLHLSRSVPLEANCTNSSCTASGMFLMQR